jgi:hypothetical protein
MAAPASERIGGWLSDDRFSSIRQKNGQPADVINVSDEHISFTSAKLGMFEVSFPILNGRRRILPALGRKHGMDNDGECRRKPTKLNEPPFHFWRWVFKYHRLGTEWIANRSILLPFDHDDFNILVSSLATHLQAKRLPRTPLAHS